MKSLHILVLILVALLSTGCASTIEIERSDVDLTSKLGTSNFYLEFNDQTKSTPDNVDGRLNLLWTNAEKREKVVSDGVKFLISELALSGFTFVSKKSESSVLATLLLKSVRFDPVGGWITDDAKLTYSATENGQDLGNVISKETLITPALTTVLKALIEGSKELWNAEKPTAHNKERNEMDGSEEPPIR